MRRFRIDRTLMVAGATVVALSSLAGCSAKDSADHQPARAAAAPPPSVPRDTAHVATTTQEAGGEVVSDSQPARPAGKWITDANVLSLLSTMNAKQIAAANVELSAWRSDTVRAFASQMAREHAELQHSIDSIAAQMRVSPVAPALAEIITDTLQAQIDSLNGFRGGALDRAFVRQQVQSHTFMADYVARLAGVAESPDLQALLSTAATRVASQLSRARTLQTAFTALDSAATADSLARLSARHKRSNTER